MARTLSFVMLVALVLIVGALFVAVGIDTMLLTAAATALLEKFKPMRLKEEKGTKPNVAYIRAFKPAHKS